MPFKRPELRKTFLCGCWVTQDELEWIDRAAEASRLSRSQFVAAAALRAAGYELVPALRRAPAQRKDGE